MIACWWGGGLISFASQRNDCHILAGGIYAAAYLVTSLPSLILTVDFL